MPQLNLSNEQVIDLVKQLPHQQQLDLFQFLLLQQWRQWESLSRYGVEKARLVPQERGFDWDLITEEERDNFIDEILHQK
ncbi:hypothetical protein PN466_04035 [Roseofilum reptotaenium CS-1145]|uniref:DUF2281 domain-containing protein n=1 Tax=Roseofilum reptotaenium AO1-A TaxID=1925591 RepID=A0A1L9QR22_9CYAN|nr:hypothetical protein [Roseofilum reptotaenium]MDB9516130.1 hypothetical protein [Roseofilum reptotaenium CS-1145]OJJ25076.1 hypothetical protein BI308_13645 [Roseofilum reptotaenium AO1-A]